MDSLIEAYRGCEIRLGDDGFHYVRRIAGGDIEYLSYAGCGPFGGGTWSREWGERQSFYGPTAARDAIDKILSN